MNYHAIVNLLFEKGLLKKIPITIPFQHLHLLNGNLIEFNEPFTLGHPIIDKHGIDIELRSTFSSLGIAQTSLALHSLTENVLHIRQAYQFVDGGIVTDIAF